MKNYYFMKCNDLIEIHCKLKYNIYEKFKKKKITSLCYLKF